MLKNFGRTYRFQPKELLKPTSEEEIIEIIKKANQENRNVRVVGSYHSWTNLVVAEDILVSLDNWQGVIKIDEANNWAEIKAGTKLHRATHELHQAGFALANLGDIDVQSIAGALSTGTHGTGKEFGTLATQLIEVTLITGKGDLITCSENQHPEIFKAAQISLGALGIITRMKLKIVPQYKLEYVSKLAYLDDMIDNFHQYNSENRNYEFYWFPHTNKVQLKLVNTTDLPIKSGGFSRSVNDIVVENMGYSVLSNLSRTFKPVTRWLTNFSANYVPKGRWINYSHKIFATKRWVHFYEMEYNVPEENFPNCIREIQQWITNNDYRVHMPLEVRYVKADDILISPANGRNCIYIAVHQFIGMEYKPYFEAVEKIFLKYGGRPHFGKMNTLTNVDFEKIHPHWSTFKNIRKQLDPNGVMLNKYLKQIFGID